MLDGANIGFFGQGKVAKTNKGAAFSYEQIDAVLRCVCARSDRVLLVLHVSHTEDASLGPDALKLVRAWRERGLLFRLGLGLGLGLGFRLGLGLGLGLAAHIKCGWT